MVERIFYYKTDRKRADKETEKLYVHNCGEVQCEGGFSIGLKKPKDYHLFIVLSGKGFFSGNGREQLLCPKQAVLIRPGDTAKLEADAEDPWNYCFISFNGTEAADFMERAGFSDAVSVKELGASLKEINALIRRILMYSGETMEDDLSRCEAAHRLVLLLGDGNRDEATNGLYEGGSSEDYVKLSIDYIHEHLKDTHVGEIAAHIGINRSYLSRVFKKKMGVSIKQYIISNRLNTACELLSSSELSIKEVAERAGYEDQLTFSKMFKRTYKISPSEYRRRAQGLSYSRDSHDDGTGTMSDGEALKA